MSKTLEEHNYHNIDATIIADSKNEHGQRITSFVCTFPRIVLAEFNTHRMLSRNSASSRAIPFEKMLKSIEENPFIPIKWMKDHSGMQGDEYWTDEDLVKENVEGLPLEPWAKRMKMPSYLRNLWLSAKHEAINHAELLSHSNVTKQFVNRLLEPFKWHTVIVTATEWENFFALRAHEAAEIHIQDLAFKMLEEYNDSEPKQLKAGEWHIPFGDTFEQSKLDNAFDWEYGFDADWSKETIKEKFEFLKVKIATARCARVSYENFEGGDDYQKDINLHDRLASMGHWSPFEHCARAMSHEEYYGHHLTEGNGDPFDENGKDTFGVSGNFRGFIQYRKMFEGENKTDNRIKK